MFPSFSNIRAVALMLKNDGNTKRYTILLADIWKVGGLNGKKTNRYYTKKKNYGEKRKCLLSMQK